MGSSNYEEVKDNVSRKITAHFNFIFDIRLNMRGSGSLFFERNYLVGHGLQRPEIGVDSAQI